MTTRAQTFSKYLLENVHKGYRKIFLSHKRSKSRDTVPLLSIKQKSSPVLASPHYAAAKHWWFYNNNNGDLDIFSPETFRSVYPILVATSRSPISPPPALVATSNAWYKMILCICMRFLGVGGGGRWPTGLNKLKISVSHWETCSSECVSYVRATTRRGVSV